MSKLVNATAHGVMGVYGGHDNFTAGVYGRTWIPGQNDSAYDSNSIGVIGESGGAGVLGKSYGLTGVQGIGYPGMGVFGISYNDFGNGNPHTSQAVGVEGQTYATTQAGIGVRGLLLTDGADSSCMAVYGDASNGSGAGVVGRSLNGLGVFGVSNGIGIRAESDGASGIGVAAEAYGAGGIGVYAYAPTINNWAFYGVGSIHLDGGTAEKLNGGMWTPLASDRRVKKDVKDFDRGIGELMRVRPVRYKYNGLGGTEDDGKEYVGVIAQELEQVLPSMVTIRTRKLNKTDVKDSDIKTIDPSDFTYILINAVKQQQRTIERQDARLTELERRSSPIASSVLPTTMGGWGLLALLPIGMLIGRRRRRE